MRHCRGGVVIALVVAGALPAMAQDCTPTCRSGYLCVRGQCVSRCNPPCASGELCLDSGECSPAPPPPPPEVAPGPVAPPYAQPGAPSAVPAGMRVSLGWARAAGIIGLSSAGVGLAMTIAIFALTGSSAANIVGLMATAFLGAMVPITAAGAGSARGDPEVSGSVGLRIVGWISYGLSLAAAVVALSIAIAADVTIPEPIVGSIAAVGVGALICMAVDGFMSAGQAQALNEARGLGSATRVRYAPIAALVPSPRGGAPGFLAGVALAF